MDKVYKSYIFCLMDNFKEIGYIDAPIFGDLVICVVYLTIQKKNQIVIWIVFGSWKMAHSHASHLFYRRKGTQFVLMTDYFMF